MEALRSIYESLGFQSVQTYVQSGNVVFTAKERDAAKLSGRISAAIGEAVGFSPEVMLRTGPEMRDVIARNPFAGRDGIEPNKLLVLFLHRDPGDEARARVAQLPPCPEEVVASGRELYIWFPNGMGRPKLPVAAVERALKTPSTGRNWNTVTKLADLAVPPV